MSHRPINVRCSVIVFGPGSVLLVHRPWRRDWVLPGGTPQPGERLLTCVRRELHEETGLRLAPGRCVVLVESVPAPGERLLDLVFLSPARPASRRLRNTEDGRHAEFVPLAELDQIALHPPIARQLQDLSAADHPTPVEYLHYDWGSAIVTTC